LPQRNTARQTGTKAKREDGSAGDGRGMFGKGIRLQILLPGSIRRQKRRQKNGGKKMSGSYIFAPIFLPFPVQGIGLNNGRGGGRIKIKIRITIRKCL
jgi:hypothetical protein